MKEFSSQHLLKQIFFRGIFFKVCHHLTSFNAGYVLNTVLELSRLIFSNAAGSENVNLKFCSALFASLLSLPGTKILPLSCLMSWPCVHLQADR